VQEPSKCNKTPIVKPKAVAVEGDDDSCFFGALLQHLGFRDCQIIQMNGRYPLSDKIYSVTQISGFPNLTSFGVAIDADRSYSGAFQSICTSLRHSKLPIPTAPLTRANGNPNVVAMILPKANTKGILEDLLLDSIKTDPSMPCVKAYFECLRQNGIAPRNVSKARIHAYLASRKKPDLSCGEASKAKVWQFNNAVFDEAKRFLSML
jgi:hypothetical protein